MILTKSPFSPAAPMFPPSGLFDLLFLKKQTTRNSRNQNQSPGRLKTSALQDHLSEFA